MPQTLVQLPDFKVLQAADREWIAQTGILKDLPANEALIQEGVPVDSLYLVLSGTLTVAISHSQAEADQEIARCSAGEWLVFCQEFFDGLKTLKKHTFTSSQF